MQYITRLLEFQLSVESWVRSTFGNVVLMHKEERCLRALEEVTELAQCGAVTREQAHAIIDQVYDKPVELNPSKEIAGSLLTILGTAYAFGVHNVEEPLNVEMCRVWKNQEKIRQRQLTKVRAK